MTVSSLITIKEWKVQEYRQTDTKELLNNGEKMRNSYERAIQRRLDHTKKGRIRWNCH